MLAKNPWKTETKPPLQCATPHEYQASPKHTASGRTHSNTEAKEPYQSIPVRNKHNSPGESENTPSKLVQEFPEAGSPMEEKKYDREKFNK